MRSLQVQFTIDDLARGEQIAGELLRARLVACAQTLGPITSRYWWDGSVHEAREWLFVAKTTDARIDEVIDLVRERHPYDVPEIIASEITAAFAPYVDWIARETGGEPTRPGHAS